MNVQMKIMRIKLYRTSCFDCTVNSIYEYYGIFYQVRVKFVICSYVDVIYEVYVVCFEIPVAIGYEPELFLKLTLVTSELHIILKFEFPRSYREGMTILICNLSK
jgi:hypothetical protein